MESAIWIQYDEKQNRPEDKQTAVILSNEPYSSLVDLDDIENHDFKIVQLVKKDGSIYIEFDARFISENKEFRQLYDNQDLDLLCEKIIHENRERENGYRQIVKVKPFYWRKIIETHFLSKVEIYFQYLCIKQNSVSLTGQNAQEQMELLSCNSYHSWNSKGK